MITYDEFLKEKLKRDNFNEENLKRITTHICPMCGKEFTSEDKPNNIKKQLFSKHLRSKHLITVQDYLIQNFHNNEPLKCLCGCGEKVKCKYGAFDTFVDDHYDKNVTEKICTTKDQPNPMKRLGMEQYLRRKGLSIDELKGYFQKFKTSEWPISKLAESIGIRPVTLKKWWFESNICTNAQYDRISRQHKWIIKQKSETKVLIDEDILLNIFNYLQEAYKNKESITLQKLLNVFNLDVSKHILYNRLIQNFGKEKINELMSSGNSSKPEINFYFTLCYFFGKKNIKKQFKLERKFYDFLLYDKILIQFDGQYWHKDKKESDNQKDEIALKNNYIIFRVSDKDANNFQIWNKLNSMVKEIKDAPSRN